MNVAQKVAAVSADKVEVGLLDVKMLGAGEREKRIVLHVSCFESTLAILVDWS